MRVSVTEAKGQLTELVRGAEAGDEGVLTRHDCPTVRLVPVQRLPNAETRRKVIAAVQAAAAEKRTLGAGAARSQDILYGDPSLPTSLRHRLPLELVEGGGDE